jgi:hypothetical protein
MPAQTPIETPPVATTPPSKPTPTPVTGTGDILGQIAKFFTSPLNILLVVGAVVGIVVVLVVLVKAVQSIHVHPLGRK